MYSFINGVIENKSENSIVVSTGGIGYEINMGTHSISLLPNVGETAKIYTYLHVREDAFMLFGFASVEEKEMFLQLITVSGVGGKMALTILSGLTPKDISKAIYSGDNALLSKIKGVGKKTAERIMLELKGKIAEPIDMLFGASIDAYVVTPSIDEAIGVLVDMGLTKFDATKIVRSVAKDGDSTEQIIAKCLKNMG